MLSVLAIATFGLIPSQRPVYFGVEVAATGAVAWFASVRAQVRAYQDVEARQWLRDRVLGTQAATLPFVVGGLLLVRGHGAGIYLVVAGTLASFGSAVLNAWVLLIENLALTVAAGTRFAQLDRVRIQVQVDVADPPLAILPEATPRAGQVLGGRYELVRLLGRGSMGTVWLARHRTLGEQVAVKVMAPVADSGGIETASTAAARFRFEAQVAARLSRKTRHVVRVTDHGHDGPVAFLVMELLEGQTLEAAFMRRGPMAPGEVAPIVGQIAHGLEVAHAEGVLHRDLKPANVFLVEGAAGEPLVKLLDFGLARGDEAQRLAAPFATARGVVFGTPGYMSPEQANGAVDADRRADVWSLAAIAYEALTGELPVEGIDGDEVMANVRAARVVPFARRRPDLPQAYAAFFARAFAPRPDDRFATCAALAEAFGGIAGAGAPVPQRVARPPRRGKTALWVLACGMGLATAIATPRAVHEWRHGRGALDRTAHAGEPATPTAEAASVPPSATPAANAPLAPPAPAPAPPPAPASASRGPDRYSAADLGEFKAHF